MNKKVLTLCAAMLLSGSSLVYAGDYVNNGISGTNWQTELNAFMGGDKPVTLSADGLKMTVNDEVTFSDQRNFLLIDKDNFVLDGNHQTWNGRIVITGENVTIKNLKINYKNVMISPNAGEDGTVIENKSAITVFASRVNLIDNEITVSSSDPNDAHVANGISIYPLTSDPVFIITGNTINNANEIANGDEIWPDSPAFGIEIIGNIPGEANNGYTYFTSKSGNSGSASNVNFSNSKISDNKINNAAIDYAYVEAHGVVSQTNPNGDRFEVVTITKSQTNDKAFNKTLKNAADNAIITLVGFTYDEIQNKVNDLDLAGKDFTIISGSYNIAVGNPNQVDNGNTTVKVDGVSETQWGNYESFKSDGTTDKVVLVFNGATVKAFKDAAGNVSYTMGNYDPNSTNGNVASQYFFTLTPYELSADEYELRLKDCYGNFVKVDGQYVTVENVNVQVNSDGNYEYKSSVTGNDWKEMDGDNTVFPTDLELKAGDKWVTIDENGSFATISPIFLAHTFGIADIQIANVYASTLLKRYGEYFTIDITYKKDEVGQTDLTSIFEGNLCPMERVEYTSGEATYIKANPWATSFMLVNEKGEILAVNKNEDDRLSEGSNNHVYPLTTITPHDYVVDQAGDKNYVTTFYFEYTPGKDVSEVTEITNIYAWDAVDRKALEIGCYLDKKVPTLVAKDGAGLLDVTIELNKGSLVDAASWLNQPAYYTVEVLNKAKDAAHKGQVLGLNENGAIDYVAATKTDINRPEGQFAISYNVNTGNYDFTNRETGETAWSLLMGDRLYKISSTEFAYLHGSHMDTLAIKPVTTYKSYDGFRRYSAADLNNNTYNIAMNLLDESFLYVVENHDDKHRIGLDREEATEWRIEIPTVKLLDAAGAQKALVADTVKVPATIKYWKDNQWVYTNDKDSKNVDGSYKYYDPNTVLEICTYILKNTDTDEYMSGSDDAEEEANTYYYCPYETVATRIALKLVGDSTVNLVPVYGYYYNWYKGSSMKESDYNANYYLSLSRSKIIGGTTSATGVLKDVDLYEATSNDLFVINEAAAPTYKKMEQGQKIVISRVENNDEVIYEKGEFAGIDNIKAYTDINPTLYVDTAYVNREGNYRYEYLLGVNINRVDTVDDCGNPNHEHPRTVFTEGRFLVNMRDSAEVEDEKNVHNNKFEYDGESKLAFVSGYHQNDTLYITDEAGKVIAKSEVGNAAPHFAKFAFKMINETNNEFVIEVGESAAKQYVSKNGSWTTVTNVEASRGYLRWHNGNLVVTPYLDQAEHFTMEASDKEATANEAISAGNVVVAGTNGAVVVKGAEGKNVIVSTILGKVVANEVVSSDNAQITAPAGIVVVSVDGESFKVVVK
ncbi:DUF6383 domain-containing protein [Parabacteroides sp. AD58]|uniref:DUF6383 domain-containing protein n=1 Tax=Parabacteroides absconsus TaxID=2951805 RepID=A0ABZ2INW6_9BACT|nr:DUF6383 domain-containing protein [Parabacteroides sp. AD58]MCM6902021.1 DUF6383 domain-containing protein [Parabacteroides sp. AD58]